ncbi:MAG: 4Fe-4S binding protein [bacterium]|nr:4Fe-4S binding protein [bacterium]
MKRNIVEINEEKCTGCGECIPDCPEGALQIIDGKARLVSDLFCDGLGACIKRCPTGALKIIERKAEPYDGKKAIENLIPKGEKTIKVHLKHLLDHGEKKYLEQALEFIKEKKIEINLDEIIGMPCCPDMKIENAEKEKNSNIHNINSFKQWPIQLHLVQPFAGFFENSDLVFAADCTGYICRKFHDEILAGKPLVIACPKLDYRIENYIEKIKQFVAETRIKTITTVIMEVPCCHGLLKIIGDGITKAGKKIPMKKIVISIKGEILNEEWL